MRYPHQLSTIQLFVLAVLLRHPMHAYGIRQEIIELSDRNIWPAYSSIQYALRGLVQAGYADSWMDDPYYWLKARRGVPYRLTDRGRWRIKRELVMYAQVLDTAKRWLQLQRGLETIDRYSQGLVDTPLPNTTDFTTQD